MAYRHSSGLPPLEAAVGIAERRNLFLLLSSAVVIGAGIDMLECRVKFDTQNAAAGDDIPLVTATKVFWANSKPTFWKLCAFVAPPVVMPLLRVLACAFPSQVSADLEDALATLYDASDCLIKVITYIPVLCLVGTEDQLCFCSLQ